jgi:hypothetical protein
MTWGSLVKIRSPKKKEEKKPHIGRRPTPSPGARQCGVSLRYHVHRVRPWARALVLGHLCPGKMWWSPRGGGLFFFFFSLSLSFSLVLNSLSLSALGRSWRLRNRERSCMTKEKRTKSKHMALPRMSWLGQSDAPEGRIRGCEDVGSPSSGASQKTWEDCAGCNNEARTGGNMESGTGDTHGVNDQEWWQWKEVSKKTSS